MNSRTLAPLLVVGVLSAVGGWFASSTIGTARDPSERTSAADGPCPGGAQPLYWKAPMDPTYVRDQPGKSPMGMDLVPACSGAQGDAPEGAVVIDAATVQNIGVKTSAVQRRDLARSVRAIGRVAYDERRVAHVHTKVQGWVETLYVDFVGQTVKKGQPLLEIYSPDLVATQEELLLAARYRKATKDSPFPDVQVGGESLIDATKRRLALWDIPERDIEKLLATGKVERTLTLYAPASGVITRLGVRNGMEVKPNSNLYTVADLSRVWVLADVYEYELPWLELGQMATVELSYLPGPHMEGELTYIAPFLDPETRTAEVRLELDNSAGTLKPEMFGNAVIAGTPRVDALAIPASAVIRSGRRTLAIVALGEGRFEPRDIELGLDTGDGVLEVLAGLSEGDEVVVSSQFLIDSESNLQEAVSKLLAAKNENDTPPPMDNSEHEGHSMNAAPSHEGHSMPMVEEPMDHSTHQGHDMSGATDARPDDGQQMDHSAHGEQQEHLMPAPTDPPSSNDDHSSHGGNKRHASKNS